MCPMVNDDLLAAATQFFKGSKLILCNGTIETNGANALMMYLSSYGSRKHPTRSTAVLDNSVSGQEQELPGQSFSPTVSAPPTNSSIFSNSDTSDSLTLQISDVHISFRNIERINAFLRSSQDYHLKELGLDMNSFGITGICSFFASIAFNQNIKILSVRLAAMDYQNETLAPFLYHLKRNCCLEELRLFGFPLYSESVKCLRSAVRLGLSSLTAIEVVVFTSAETEADILVEVCKARAYAGLGVSCNITTVDD